MEKLTLRQQQVLDFIASRIDGKGLPPTLREIAGHLGTSGNISVLNHLKALEKKGYLLRESGSSRGIMLVREPLPEMVSVPIAGLVRAGDLTLAVEDIEGYYPLEKVQLRGGTFFLRVKGDSMVNDAIVDGDLVLIRPQQTADNGDIVVAMIDGEATLKRFYRERDHIRLQPRNPNMAAIIIPAGEELAIIGKAVKIIRNIE
ncbi:transcriptional repressor LexA [Geobacter pelophilus]|uniref:LexA repressor n=1 Tax=Geoanaerobacter pelophilus TaxID=60036 RepID=A0AAW4L4J2_9BACT|nr:transcriptional repressor LexA [Geoanaerobacter pelophilus]MBT0664482.1 transcriptional repressor LexA [Geoanaerobacter pelophilus]